MTPNLSPAALLAMAAKAREHIEHCQCSLLEGHAQTLEALAARDSRPAPAAPALGSPLSGEFLAASESLYALACCIAYDCNRKSASKALPAACERWLSANTRRVAARPPAPPSADVDPRTTRGSASPDCPDPAFRSDGERDEAKVREALADAWDRTREIRAAERAGDLTYSPPVGGEVNPWRKEKPAEGPAPAVPSPTTDEDQNADPWCVNCGHAGSDHRPQINGSACGAATTFGCHCAGYVPEPTAARPVPPVAPPPARRCKPGGHDWVSIPEGLPRLSQAERMCSRCGVSSGQGWAQPSRTAVAPSLATHDAFLDRHGFEIGLLQGALEVLAADVYRDDSGRRVKFVESLRSGFAKARRDLDTVIAHIDAELAVKP